MRITPLLLLLLACAAPAASAQIYRCAGPNGTAISDRPCGTTAASPAPFGAYGPAPERAAPRHRSAPADPPRVGEHVKYLGSECSSLSEAIRTGPARGTPPEALRGLRDEYRFKCAVEDREARKQAQADERDRQRAQVASLDAVRAQRREEESRRAHCAGLRDAIAARRSRESQLNATEVSALRDLERSFNERCLSR